MESLSEPAPGTTVGDIQFTRDARSLAVSPVAGMKVVGMQDAAMPDVATWRVVQRPAAQSAAADSAAAANRRPANHAFESRLPTEERLAYASRFSFVSCYDFRVLGGRTNEQWIEQYGSSHQHPVNRICHTLGIPTILLSVPVFIASIFVHRLWLFGAALFLIGWIFQFIGHAFEGKPPEFFQDWRFLLVGVRWWWAKINGKA
jgi:hypothetical protein